jgi:bifunctional oligoribonuclease and PAP phosphatase NrnA
LLQKNISAEIGTAESVSKVARKFSKDVLVDPDCSQFDNIILVDTSVPEQLKGIKNIRADIVIDHHPKGALCGENCLIDEDAKSSAQLVFKVLQEMKCEITKEMANVILAGLVADTAHLRIAELREFRVLTELIELGANYKEVLGLLQTKQDFSEKIACLKAAMRTEFHRSKDVLIVFSRVVSHEAASCRALLWTGADLAIVVARKKDQLRISSRGKHVLKGKGIDLSVIFKGVGEIIGGNGGGHDLAGSANGPDTRKIQEVKKFILQELTKKLGRLEMVER